MKKILTKTLAVVLCFAFAFSVASCGEGEKTKEDYKLSFVSAGDGYAVEIGRGGENGALRIRVCSACAFLTTK